MVIDLSGKPELVRTAEYEKRMTGENMSEEFSAGENQYSYKEVLKVSLPLVVSTGTTMVMEFTDRAFLSNYDLDAIAAATPAGITAFLFISFFMGVSGYVNVFIAQYTGAGEPDEVGKSLWQGIWFSLLAGFFLTGLYFLAPPLFRMGGHAPEIQRLEVVYFRILCLGGGLCVLEAGLSCFYSGRGRTGPVMGVHLAGAVFNIPLNYALINGAGPFPELGMAGAGIATVASWALIVFLFTLMIFNSENDRKFGVFKSWRPDRERFRRLLRFGVPGAVQFSMDIFAFTFFIFMVGRIGKSELAVTNIVLSINSLAYMPMVGFSMGVSTLVGHAVGRNRPEDGETVVRNTFRITYIYMGLLMAVFLFTPECLLRLFQPESGAADYAVVETLGADLLKFVACYIFFDAHYMVFVGALKGAGDTGFIMWSMIILSLLVMAVPVFIGIEFFQAGVYFAWSCSTLYIISLCISSFLRYRLGYWKAFDVIEKGRMFDTLPPQPSEAV